MIFELVMYKQFMGGRCQVKVIKSQKYIKNTYDNVTAF